MTLDNIIPYLPHLQATLNTISAILLTMGYIYIRNKNTHAHRRCMISALVVSAVFLISYLTYHAAVGYLPFTGQGFIRPIYFTILFTHVTLAALIVPMVLITVFFALRNDFVRHPKMAKWTLPLWFYVSVSGVIIYLFGFHFYAQA